MPALTRDPVARVQAQGSARSGAAHWIESRLTSAALVPLGLWLAWAALALGGAPYEEARARLAGPFHGTALLLAILVAFRHAYLGLQVIVEDYVHGEAAKLGALVAAGFACAALGLACALAALKVSLGS